MNLTNWVEEYHKLGAGPWTVASAPGRVDFLNTHQDYKGLPVIPVAINLHTYVFGKLWTRDVFRVRSLDLEALGEEATDTFPIIGGPVQERGWFGNYLRGVVNVLHKRGLAPRLKGIDVIIKSDIPIGSGLASSAALEVAFALLLNHVFNLGYDAKNLAEIAYHAETQEVGVPCGRLDQYGVAFGGIVKLECRPPYNVEPLPFTDLTFAIIDSGIRHSTGDIHPFRQDDINRGLMALMESKAVPRGLKARLGYRYDQPLWEKVSEQDVSPYLSTMDERSAKRILFTLKMHESTETALDLLRLKTPRRERVVNTLGEKVWEAIMTKPENKRVYWALGEVMNWQHILLRDFYDVSLPELERIREAAIEAGAYGVKISGAGMGGSLIALVNNPEAGYKILEDASATGAKRGWVSGVGKGASIIHT